MQRDEPLYPFLLGPAYDALPAILQEMHRVAPRIEAAGFGTVTHGTNGAARLLARLLGFPGAGIDRPLVVTFERDDGIERLSRRYPDRTLTTLRAAARPALRRPEGRRAPVARAAAPVRAAVASRIVARPARQPLRSTISKRGSRPPVKRAAST